VFEPPGDLGFEQEAGAAVTVVGTFGSEFLAGNLAVELGPLGKWRSRSRPRTLRPGVSS
jgi:hypothetical protein